MIRCHKCGATNADGKSRCSVCGQSLNHRFTAEIESDVLDAIAALAPERAAAVPPPGSVAERIAKAPAAAPTIVRNEGPRTIFGRSAGERTPADEVPHPVLDGASGLPKTIIKDRGFGQMFGAKPKATDATTLDTAEESDGTFFGIGTVAADDAAPEATAFGVPVDDSGLGQRPAVVPDWLASIEDELRDSDEFDRFVGPGPSESAVGRGDQSGAGPGTRLGVGNKAGPSFDLDDDEGASRTDPGVPGDAPGSDTNEPAAGVLRKRSKSRGGAAAARNRTPRRDLRIEEDDTAGAAQGVAFDSTFTAGPSSTVASPAMGPARATVDDLGFADTGAFEAFQADARQRIAARTGGAGASSGPHPRRSPATGSSSPRPARVEAAAPDAAWDVYVPDQDDATPYAAGPNPSGPNTTSGTAVAAPPPGPASTTLASARRIVVAVAAVVIIVCLAFGAFLVWLVDV